MKCLICFFRDEVQLNLKKRSFGISRFENKLESYRDNFIHELKSLTSISKCTCNSDYNVPNLIKFTDDFLIELKNNTSIIETIFNEIISFYIDSISKSLKIGMDNLWNFLESNKLTIEREPSISYIRLFFRGRPTDTFDTKNSKEFFHIPFSKRELISHQRFSVSGQPMLYLGSSLPTVLKELDKPVEDLSFAGFLPFWSLFDNHKIFSLKNSMNVVLENVLPGVFESGSMIDYDNNHTTFSKDYFVENMQNTILMQLCTFPTEKAKANFVEEYILPQMLASALLEKGYTGIIFPSTRDFSDIQNNHRFSEHHLNLGIYITYDSSNDIDESLYDSFFKFTLNGNEKFCFSIDDVLKEIDLLSAKNRTSKYKMNDLIMPVVKLKLHLEYLNNSTIGGEKYFDSKVGKIELEFYMKMLDVLNKETDKINSQTTQSSALV